MTKDLTGKVALVTGASRGLGRHLAETLASAGAQVVISSRSVSDLSATARELRDLGLDVVHFAADNAVESDLESLTDYVLAECGRIDILVNNAGALWRGPAVNHSMDDWDAILGLNLRSVFHLSQIVARKAMIPQGSGRILNMASIGGMRGSVGRVSYMVSKAGVIALTRALAKEWAPHGITVNALAPGVIESDMTLTVLRDGGRERLISEVPMGRIGRKEDLSGIARLLCSDAANFITGQTVAIDGGIIA
jgi:NAD(P)-dependent dehydrogenase (short-subunit alcohol dehydrogenase family)